MPASAPVTPTRMVGSRLRVTGIPVKYLSATVISADSVNAALDQEFSQPVFYFLFRMAMDRDTNPGHFV